MELGILISVTGIKEKDFLEGARKAKQMGYAHVELGAVDMGQGTPCADVGQYTPGRAAEQAQQIRALGLGISALQCHVDLCTTDEERRWQLVQHVSHVTDLAKAMGCDFVHTVSGPLPEGQSPEEAFAQLAATYDDILESAAYGVRVGIEPVFVYLVGNLETTRRLLAYMDRDDLYINFDPSHFPYHREDPVAFVEEFGSRILHAHAKDATVTPLNERDIQAHVAWDMGGGEMFRFAPPGHGVLDWPAIIGALRRVGFDGVISLELGHGIEDEEAAAREAARFLSALIE
jgi:sugar phosphate isomerase/epimerase